MRTKILAALSVTTLVLSACGGEAPPPDAPAPPPPPPAVTASVAPPADTTPPPPPKPALADLMAAAGKGMGDAFNAHDAGKFASYFSDDVASYMYGAPEHHSRGDLTTGMTALFTAFPDIKSAATRVWSKGNVMITEIAWTGTMSGDMGPFKATGKQAGGMRLHISFFNDDGLVKEMHEYADEASAGMQLMGKKGAPPVPTLPTNPPEMHMGKGTPDEDKLVDWAKAGDDVFSKDDPKAVLAGMADDADYWLNLGGPAMKGKKDLEKGLKAWFKTLPDQKWTVSQGWGIDGFAIIEHTVSGTAKGPMGPLPASNKPVQNWHFVDILQPTADGKIQHGWGYTNLNEMLAQTGQLPKPPVAKAPPATGKAPPPAKKP